MQNEQAEDRKVSISGISIDPEIVDTIANAWITINVDNHTKEEQPVMASIVVAQGEYSEKIEIAERVSPFGGVIEAVIRIVDPEMWQPDESGAFPQFDCMVGLEIADEVMDVAAVKFDAS